MKECTKCGEAKSLDRYGYRSKKTGKLNSWCKDCINAYSAQKYYDNRKYLYDYLLEHPCVDCGETDPLVLEFDHKELRGPEDKTVSSLTNVSKKRMDEEIAKCEVRCANCHTKRTRVQMGWRDYSV